MTSLTIDGEGISVDREVSEGTGLKIMEIAFEHEASEDESTLTVRLRGEGIEFTRDLPETVGVKILDLTVHEGAMSLNDNSSEEGLPEDFFDRLSTKQRIMLEILLEADGEWMRGTDIRQKMRDEYGLEVGEGGRATAGVIAGLTRKYDEDFRREVIPGQWADETQQHAEFRIGDKYKEEIRVRFEE
jgi:hypothetical protein